MWETWVRSLGWEDPWRRERWLPTPAFWPGEFHGLYRPWGHKESDTTERLSLLRFLKAFFKATFTSNVFWGSTMLWHVSEFHSFLKQSIGLSLVYPVVLFIRSSAVGHLGGFHPLATVNSAAMNSWSQVSIQLPACSSLGYTPEVELLDSKVILCSVLWGTSKVFSPGTVPFHIPTSSTRWRQFLPILVTTSFLFSFLFYGWLTFHWVSVSLFIYSSSVDVHLGNFYLLAAANSSPMNTGLHVFILSLFSITWVYTSEWNAWVIQ